MLARVRVSGWHAPCSDHFCHASYRQVPPGIVSRRPQIAQFVNAWKGVPATAAQPKAAAEHNINLNLSFTPCPQCPRTA
eukprot:4417780-Amphidinium_carterae.2